MATTRQVWDGLRTARNTIAARMGVDVSVSSKAGIVATAVTHPVVIGDRCPVRPRLLAVPGQAGSTGTPSGPPAA
jgi:hypothetical protein